MAFPDHFELKHYIVIAIAVLYILKRALANKPLVEKYNVLISTLLITALAIFIAVEFWTEQQWFGFIALGFAAIAIVKAVYDTFFKK
ncbi:hypothetical protein ACFLRI_01605 [Bacteroidota bacterium]